MGERKVVNTYIPADFDPTLIPRGKKLSAKDGTVPVRMMLPFSLQCSTCHTFLYRGRKFNSKKEAMGGPDGKYLGITRWRFYIKCTHCSRPITFLTDPKNADYEMESGGVRNYEIQKDKVATEEEAAAEHEKEEKEDPMKALENRVLESQKEMADLDNLEEIKAMNARHVKLLSGKRKVGSGDGSILGNAEPEAGDEKNAPFELTEEDEALIKSIQFGKKQAPRQQHAANMSELKRLDEDDEWQMEERRKRDVAAMEERQRQLKDKAAASQQSSTTSTNMPTLIVKKQRRLDAIDNGTTKTTQSAVPLLSIPTMTVAASSSRSIDVNGGSRAHDAKLGGLADLLGGYSSDNGNTNMAEPAVSTSVPTKMAVAASSSSSSIKVDDGSRADAKLGGLADLLGGYSSDDSD